MPNKSQHGVKVSVLLSIIIYVKNLPTIHKAKTSCRKRYQDQTNPFSQIKHCLEKYVHRDKMNRKDACQVLLYKPANPKCSLW